MLAVAPKIHPQISRFTLGSDATHLTGIDPSAKTLTRLLRQTIGDTQIDLIHAHGTGTVMNDPIELTAINNCLPTNQTHSPHLYSHKGAPRPHPWRRRPDLNRVEH